MEECRIDFIVRDFSEKGLQEKKTYLKEICMDLKKKYPKAQIDVHFNESYRNMKFIIDQYPQVMEYAVEAIKKTGLIPRKSMVRGGTDGARLSYMGLPTPNIFTGGHNFHSKKEWIAVQDMQKAIETIIHLVRIWTKNAKDKS